MVAKMQRAADVSDLSQIVLNRIQQRPEASEAHVSVAADHGIVTLTGNVKSKSERIAVETVAKQVRGVRAVANDLEVKPAPDRTSTEIARGALRGLRSHIFLAPEDITVIVRDGRVTLEGKVHSELQRMLAEAEVKRLQGIFGISNQLEVEPDAFTPVQVDTAEPENGDLSNDSAWADIGEAEAG